MASIDLQTLREETPLRFDHLDKVLEISSTNRDFTVDFASDLYRWQLATLGLPEAYRPMWITLSTIWQELHASHRGTMRRKYLQLLGLRTIHAKSEP